ncbi:nitrogen assimilation transcriptional regulator NAC [Pseudomonas sp. TH31]|uniref:nitrogen assimilation transcriptional regulator NAC n=1 Tax=Pseudomonas sp. TH31 TaxID=2796396 RepID=UPI00191185A5|nr:nitrogen assimilation transcriptional regulator NAC [Pseudomonas sp. TH31]MBK5416069.1 nitrogen assimilation transcriptional regulator NAC [Pseudomonas sp. TH31]
MNLRRLKYFVSIVDVGSLTQAADILHIAQPALSQQLITLEAEFHQKLLIRTQRGVIPTEAGLALYRHAQIILRQVEQARQDVGNVSQALCGQVSVGLVPGTAASALAVPLLKAVREQHSGILLYLNESMGANLHAQVLSGTIDMAVLYGASAEQGLTVQVLIQEPLYLVAPANLDLGGRRLPLEAMANLDLILPHPDNYLRQHIDEVLQQQSIHILPVAAIESAIPLAGAIAAGIGASILPASAARIIALSSGAHLYALDHPAAQVPLALCISAYQPLSEPAAAVRDILMGLAEDLSC